MIEKEYLEVWLKREEDYVKKVEKDRAAYNSEADAEIERAIKLIAKLEAKIEAIEAE